MFHRIFICEDDPIQLLSLKQYVANYSAFHERDFSVSLATQMPEEIQKFVETFAVKGGIYFLDIDLGVGHINGLELAEWIRKHDAEAKISFITTHNEMVSKVVSRHIECLSFIYKDDNIENIHNEISYSLHEAQRRIDAIEKSNERQISYRI